MKIADKRQAKLLKLINKSLEERLRGIASFYDNEQSFIGYNPLEKIRNRLFHWCAVPFNKVDVWCQLRCPNATQIEQCGEMSNITLDQNEKDYEYNYLIKIRNYQEALCKLVFNNPTFNNIVKMLGDYDFAISEKRNELERIKKQYEEEKGRLSGIERETIELKIRTINLEIGFILPDDTMSFIVNWAMGNDVSDIKRITKENFLHAASLAKIHGKAPTDYLSGVFTDYNKIEIDTYAIHVLEEHIKEHEMVNKGKFRFLGGGKDAKNAELPKRG
jgi:hypothetical protein